MANVSKKLAVTTAGIALSCVAMEANPAKAAVITYDFTVTGTGNVLSGQLGSGFFTYDDATTPFFGFFDVLDFSFNYLGTTYTRSPFVRVGDFRGNDFAGYGGYSTSSFAGLEAVLGVPPQNQTPGLLFQFTGNSFFNAFTLTNAEPPFRFNVIGIERASVAYTLHTTPTSVLEPATLGGLCALGLSSIFLKKKGTSK